MRLVVAALVLLASQTAPAEDGETMTYGAGVASCGKWLEARKAENYYTYGQWVLGYISAMSMELRLKQSDSDAISAWMDNYCREHPLDTIQTATLELLSALYLGPKNTAPATRKKK